LVQPDGYVGQEVLESPLYNSTKSEIYDWLRNEDFKVYDGFRSNYPASLNSNSSLLTMRQHRFGGGLYPSFEQAYTREIISGDNPVLRIFKNNGYRTVLIAEDEYFQQNLCDQYFDAYNVDLDQVAYFSDGSSVVRDVLEDTRSFLQSEQAQPVFYFIEKCMPHHAPLWAPEDRVNKERNDYLGKLDETNEWIKATVLSIEEKDPNAIIIVLADHGGWLGLEDFDQMFETKDETYLWSIYSALAAIKWNGYLEEGYDAQLRTNVNLFRILFASLSQNNKLLDHLEDNSSYNLTQKNTFFKGVRAVLDDSGNVVEE